MINQGFISYHNVREHKILAQLLLTEIPETNAISFPIPSLHFSEPAFVQFSAPAHRIPLKPMYQESPDRWWAIGAKTGILLFYALCKVWPIGKGHRWPSQELTRINITMEQFQEKMLIIEQLTNELAPAFFLSQVASFKRRSALWETYQMLIPKQLMEQYQKIAPDFFDWLINPN